MRFTFRISATLALALATGLLIGSATAATKKTFLYVHDRSASGQLLAFAVDAQGLMTAVPGSPFALPSATGCGGDCQTAAYSAKRKLLFAAGTGISVFQVAKTGVLTPVVGSPFGSFNASGTCVVEKGTNTFVYSADYDADSLRGYQVQADGSLAELAASPFACDGPTGVFSAGGKVFVANEDIESLSSFTVAGNGALTAAPGSPFATGAGFIYNVFADPSGKSVYTGDNDAGLVFGFSVNAGTGALTALPGSPFASAVTPQQGTAATKTLLIGQDGTAAGSNDIQVFRRNKTTGVLTALGGAQSSVVDDVVASNLLSTGKLYAVASEGGGSAVRTFRVDKTTGVLTLADTEVPVITKATQVLWVQR